MLLPLKYFMLAFNSVCVVFTWWPRKPAESWVYVERMVAALQRTKRRRLAPTRQRPEKRRFGPCVRGAGVAGICRRYHMILVGNVVILALFCLSFLWRRVQVCQCAASP